jgi:hypothetical protein
VIADRPTEADDLPLKNKGFVATRSEFERDQRRREHWAIGGPS